MELTMSSPHRLTQYEPASFREIAKLSFSFIIVLFSASFMGLCDRLILAHSSIEGLEAGITALWLSQLFQVPIIRAASMAQAFVGQYKGAGQLEKIGPCVWQMIWFSLLSMLITWPVSRPIGSLFFQNAALQEGLVCFRWLMLVNFLFPLGTALSAFYLGQGKTKRVLLTSLASHSLHILLDFPLVFGISSLLPPLGALGSILSAILAQLFFCGCLLFDFLSPKHHLLYYTHQFAFSWTSFWSYLRVGLPRTGAKLIQLGAWIAMTGLIVAKGEDYAAVLAFGGSLQMFLTCLNEGLSQALTTIGAYLIGSKQSLIWKAIRSGSLFLFLEGLILALPLCIFPESVVALFFKQPISPLLGEALNLTCLWIWLLFLMEGLNLIGYGLLSAYGDTVFQMKFAGLVWITGCLPTYFAIQLGDASPDRFWLITAGACCIAAIIYFVRLSQKKEKISQELLPR